MLRRPAFRGVRRTRRHRYEWTTRAESGLVLPGCRLIHCLWTKEEFWWLAVGVHVETSCGSEVAFGDRSLHRVTIALRMDQKGASGAVHGIPAPRAWGERPEDATSQIVMEVEEMSVPRGPDPRGDGRQGVARFEGDDLIRIRVVIDQRGMNSLRQHRNPAAGMAAPEGSEERSHQEHVADRAEANDEDVGGGKGGRHRGIMKEKGERRKENGPSRFSLRLSPSRPRA